MIPDRDISQLREVLGPRRRIALLSHVNPDGDSIGSSLALYHFLRHHGHEVSVLVPNDLPAFLAWLPGAESIRVAKRDLPTAIRTVLEAEVIFFLDFNEASRLRELATPVQEHREAFTILIDHHPDPRIEASLVFSETRVSSTAELLYRVMKSLDPSPLECEEVAVNLYAGIMTDTGCFRYNAAYPGTWRSVAELVERGIDIDDIYARIYDNYSEHRMRLMGYALDQKMVILPDLHTGYIWLTKEELERYSYVTGDTEGFVNLPLSVEGIRFSALFLELGDRVKISFRSKGHFAVNEFSNRYFNGGGHRNAAGGECSLTMEETIDKFERLLKTYRDKI